MSVILRALGCIALLPLAFAACAPKYQRHQAHIMGPFDTVTILLGYAESARAFNNYAAIVFERLETLHRMYDIFNAYDNLNNLHTINANAGIRPVEVEQEIIDMLLAAQKAYAITRGRTNAAMGSVLRIWHDYRMRGLADPENAALPSMDALMEAAGRMSMTNVVIDEENRTVFIAEEGVSLDVGSIAKGYAAGLALTAAKEAGLRNALLSVGGHIVAIGAPPRRGHWNVAIQNPETGREGAPHTVDTIPLTNATVSISGAYQRFYMVDGLHFGHVIDPDTLMPATLYKQVAVIHPQSWMADALSTALFILPRGEGETLAEATGAEAFWIDMDGNWFATLGYSQISSVFE
ncbi:MAG: FAD:protein FMN transferase [Treponema sp.]|nr:FAD:protein FMN transferase [Treponema sp.]